MNRDSLTLYGITDRLCLKNDIGLTEAVVEAIEGGVTMIQLREKELKGTELLHLAKDIQSICKRYQIPFIINDDVMLAKEIDADGVHVGQSDMACTEARRILSSGKIVGVTAKTVEQAVAAEKAGADYLGSGALFGSETKTDAVYMTKETFVSIIQAVKIPVVGIGGINRDNASELSGLGASGIAVVSGIFGAWDIRKASEELRSIADRVRR